MLHASPTPAASAAGASSSSPSSSSAARIAGRVVVAPRRLARGRRPAAPPPSATNAADAAPAATVDAGKARSCADRVRLGRSDLLASAVTLGTMTWGKQNTEREAHEQLSYAIDERGVNALDTAEIYPVPPAAETRFLTDKYIGSWLKTRPRGREGVLVFTKVAGFGDRTAWVRDPPETCKLDRRQIGLSVDASLKRLGVDHIDLLQAHWPQRYVGGLFGAPSYDIALERPDDGVGFEETLRGFEDVIKAGKVRYVGVSNETSWGVTSYTRLAESANLPRIATIQNVYSLLQRGGFETDLAECCRREGVSLLAYSPLAGGALSNKYATTPLDELKGSRFNLFEGYMKRYNDSLAREAVAEYARVAKEAGITPAALALGWVRSRWFVASNIIGATTMAQLKENLDAYDAPPLGDDVIAAIGAVYKRYRDPPTSPL